MSKKTEIITPEVVQMNAELDTDSLLALGLSQAEEYAEGELARFLKLAEESRHKEADYRNEYSKKGEELAAEKMDSEKESVEDACRALGIKDFETSFGFQSLPGQKNPCVQYSLRVTGAKESKKSNSQFNVTKNVTVPEPASLRDLAEKAREQSCLAEKYSSQAMDMKKRLSRMPQLERKMRGRLAKQKLEGSQEGRDIIAALTGDIQQQVLALPCR